MILEDKNSEPIFFGSVMEKLYIMLFQSTVWVFQNEPKPTKVIRSRDAAKQMIACFFGYTGHVTTVDLEES